MYHLSNSGHSLLSFLDSSLLFEFQAANHKLSTDTHPSKNFRPFDIVISNLFTFINSSDENKQVRSFVVGLLFHPSGALLYNLNKLKYYLHIAKSGIAKDFIHYGFTDYIDPTQAQLILIESFNRIINFSSEIKQWSVRVKKSSAWKFQPQTLVIEFQNQNIQRLNEQLDHIGDFPTTLLNTNIIIDKLNCEKCQNPMIKESKESSYLGYHWRCLICEHTQSSTVNSIFEGTRVPPDTGIRILYYFAWDKTIDETVHETKINHKTVQNLFSEICSTLSSHMTIQNNLHQIGGPGKHVQIDETFVSKRKYNVGRMCSSYWIVGGICEETNEIFMDWTAHRDSAVMRFLIKKYVGHGTIIATDGWKAYNILDNDGELRNQYSHKTVNHKYEFVASDGTHTQKIERLWGEFKQWKRQRRGFYFNDLDNYFQEFRWRRNIKIAKKDPFEEIKAVIKR
jgi:IS1 family transposase